MLYCDYDTYTANGGTMSAQQYGIWGQRASRKIDELTLGRAEAHAAELKAELADACGLMADAMLRQADIMRSSSGGMLTGANNDGYSESYAAGSNARRSASRELLGILSDALGVDKCNLLYKGCC